MKQNNRKAKASEKLDKRFLFVIGGLIFVFFFYMKSKNLIINYPTFLNYIAFGFSFLLIGILNKWNWIRMKIIEKTIIGVLVYLLNGLLPHLILAFFISGILLIPFNYSNIYLSKNSPSEVIYCNIESLTARARNSKIFFRFNGEMEAINDHKSVMNDIYKKQPVKDFVIKLTVRKGLLDSYVISDWNIIRK